MKRSLNNKCKKKQQLIYVAFIWEGNEYLERIFHAIRFFSVTNGLHIYKKNKKKLLSYFFWKRVQI